MASTVPTPLVARLSLKQLFPFCWPLPTLDGVPDITEPPSDACVFPVPAVALVAGMGLPAGVVTVGVVIAVVVAVGATPVVGTLVGVAPGVFVAVGVLTTVGVTVAVLITVGVTEGRVVTVGVTTVVGVTAGGVGDGFGLGVTVTPGVGVLCCCVGVAEACRAGTLVCPLLSVTLTCGVRLFPLVGLARQGIGVTVSTGVAAT